MAQTPRERLEELRAFDAETPRDKLARLRRAGANQLPAGTSSDSIVEPIKAVASGVAGTISGGLAGAAQAMNPLSEEGAGAKTVQGVQEAMTIPPQTQAGQEGLEKLFSTSSEIMDLLSFGGMVPAVTGGVADILTGGDLKSGLETAIKIKQKGLPRVLADKTFEVTESPLAATSVLMAPDLGEMILGGAGLAKSIKPATTASKELARDIQRGSWEGKYIDNGSGYFINGPAEAKKIYNEAVKQGIDPGVITVLKGSHPVDKGKMQSMVDIFKKSLKDTLYAVDNRPSDIAGASMMERVNFVIGKNKEAGIQLDKVANTLKGKQVDISAPTRKFAEDMDGFGIKLVSDKKGGFRPDFEDSSLPPGDHSTIKEVVRQISRLNKKPVDGYAIHELKKIIDRNVTYGKKDTSLSNEAAAMLKGYRRQLDESLDSRFPEYDEVNTTFAQTRTAIDGFQDVMGRKIDLSGEGAHVAVGVKLRGLTSNILSRTQLNNAITEMNKTAANYGGVFDDSVKVQMVLAEELNKIKPAASTSLLGEVGKAGRSAVTQSKGEAALNAAAAVKDKAFGISNENAIKAIEALLK